MYSQDEMMASTLHSLERDFSIHSNQLDNYLGERYPVSVTSDSFITFSLIVRVLLACRPRVAFLSR
jgi:hypothetical protein